MTDSDQATKTTDPAGQGAFAAQEKSQDRRGPQARVRRVLAGIITGGADNDPAAITTYSVAGAQSGYSQLWLMVLATPMLIAIQSIAARIGDVTRKGVGQVLREQFPRPVAYLVIAALIVTTVLMIGADLVAIGAAFELIFRLKFILFIVPVATAIWLLVLFTRFETFTRYLGFIVIIFMAYIVSAVLAHPDWGEVARSLALPPIQLKYSYITLAVGILGATFTPPLFFWQAQAEIEESGGLDMHEMGAKAQKQDKLMAPGFIFGQLITLFIMIATAATLYQHHQTIQTAADAAKALEPFAGPAARYLFAVGLIGAGLIAIPVLASSAGYMVAEVFGWRQSLSAGVDAAKGFYIVITLALFVGVELAISGIDPVQAMFYSQLLSGIVAPFVMLLLLIISNRKRIMGKYTNRAFDNIFAGLAFFVMTASTLLLLVQTIQGK